MYKDADGEIWKYFGNCMVSMRWKNQFAFDGENLITYIVDHIISYVT